MTRSTRAMLVGLAVALVPLPGAAQQDGPSIDCGSASGVVSATVCSDAAIGASDGRVARQVEAVIDTLTAQGEEGAEALADFEQSQRDWSAARDECARSTDPRGCVAEAYAAREAELVASFELAEPDRAVSYTCPGQAAGGLSISFYDLDMPAVRIEGAGADAVTGTAATTVDGAKYALSSGQEVWVRKDVARFTSADGTTVTCLADGN